MVFEGDPLVLKGILFVIDRIPGTLRGFPVVFSSAPGVF